MNIIRHSLGAFLFLAASVSSAATLWVTNDSGEDICFLVMTNKSTGNPECLAATNVKAKYVNTGLRGFNGVKWWLGGVGSKAESGTAWLADQAKMGALEVQGKLSLGVDGKYTWAGVETTGAETE